MQKSRKTYKLNDIRGNLLQVKDPYGRTVFEHVYDLRAPQEDENGEKQPLPPLWTKHIDSGASVTWWDATGKVIRSEDEKGAVGLSAYGALNRPSFSWAKDNGLEDFTVRMALVYGDDTSHGPANPKTTNHWGQAYKNYDESGLDTILAYDFKGNVLTGKKQVIKDSLLIDAINAGASNNWEVAPYRVDWTATPWNEETNLLEGNYETDNVFDALNRPTHTTYPEDINHVRKVATTTYNRAGALQKLEYDGVDYIEHIAYDAKGSVIMTAYGNGIMTRSLYDRVTFRLKRVRTSAFIRSAWTFNDNAGVKEDKVFTYDLQGNIVSTHDKCTDCGLPSSPDDLTRNFTYDSIYRLLTATGRESNTQPSSDVWNDAAPTPSPNAQNCRTYTQTFEYDKLGNILKKIHTATGNNFTRRYNYQPGTNQLLNIDNNQPTPTVIASFVYDVKGNQTLCQSEKHYEWNYADRMRSFYNQTGTGVEPTVYAVYLYDGGGNRTKKLVRKQGGSWESVTYVGGSFEYHKKGTEEKNYTQIANVEIRTGSFTGDGSETTLYQLKDHLGSVGVRLNHSGSTIDREEYYPFGDSSLRTFIKKRYRYCGKEKDEESGLYYYGARYYMSWAARFISIDPLAADYVQLTPYNYAGNKPITYYDIDGMQSNGESKALGGDKVAAKSNTRNNKTSTDTLVVEPELIVKAYEIVSKIFNPKQNSLNIQVKLHAAAIEYARTPEGKKFFSNASDFLNFITIIDTIWVDSFATSFFGVGRYEEYNKSIENAQTTEKKASIIIQRHYQMEYEVVATGFVLDSIFQFLTGAAGATSGFNSIPKVTYRTLNINATKEIDGLIKAGNALDKGGFTAVGRALQKHGSRKGSIFPKATGNTASINAQGEAVLKGILTNPNVTSVARYHARFGNVLEYRILGGQGARFSGDGKTFIGFLE